MNNLPKLFLVFLMLSFSSAGANENKVSYPERAWYLGQSGSVDVMYDIGDTGKAENVRVISSTPAYLFDDAVRDQIYKWRFPKGRPEKDIRIKISFERS
ncbi:TonB family protein [Candidatus Pantoea multigeneris]|uniref:Protein TonB n=1 Tax=Candidatus Pantoea multigeneris TaxID=2608357 RepID=A0ABX0R880_9GAMM|nr:TonB family protein [Pantoea multigeneris]NIF20567.1 TonB family protein [Pantoea multigeneris]